MPEPSDDSLLTQEELLTTFGPMIPLESERVTNKVPAIAIVDGFILGVNMVTRMMTGQTPPPTGDRFDPNTTWDLLEMNFFYGEYIYGISVAKSRALTTEIMTDTINAYN